MNPMQLIMQSNNPMGMMQQMYGNDPIFKRAIEMTKGKSTAEVQQTIRNIARSKGMDEQQLSQFVSQFGLRL